MNEKPILFSGEMVRAILDGRKTQTRRVITEKWQQCESPEDQPQTFVSWCPYGQPGDRLWVKETFAMAIPAGASIHAERKPVYRADGEVVPKWKPSIFMPRWASRITLEIVNVRVERLQGIGGTDAFAEGGFTVTQFIELWNSINASRGYGWDANPWVWIIEFKRIEQ